MATWFPASQLLLIALSSWNVHCFPVTNGWSPRGQGSFTMMEVPPGLYYSSSQNALAQPSSVSYPAVPFLYKPVKEGAYSSPGTYPASPSQDMSSVPSWNAAPGWDPMDETTNTNTMSGTPRSMPDSLPLPPPLFQAGELENYEVNFSHGNSERETEEPSLVPSPLYPVPVFVAGELSHYASVYEHGNEEGETEEQGFMPLPPYASALQGAEELSAASMYEEGPVQPVSQEVGALGPNEYYLFLTGQLPPGEVSHFQSDYETGRDHWGYSVPSTQLPIITTQTQKVPSDGLWLQPQDYAKA